MGPSPESSCQAPGQAGGSQGSRAVRPCPGLWPDWPECQPRALGASWKVTGDRSAPGWISGEMPGFPHTLAVFLSPGEAGDPVVTGYGEPLGPLLLQCGGLWGPRLPSSGSPQPPPLPGPAGCPIFGSWASHTQNSRNFLGLGPSPKFASKTRFVVWKPRRCPRARLTSGLDEGRSVERHPGLWAPDSGRQDSGPHSRGPWLRAFRTSSATIIEPASYSSPPGKQAY